MSSIVTIKVNNNNNNNNNHNQNHNSGSNNTNIIIMLYIFITILLQYVLTSTTTTTTTTAAAATTTTSTTTVSSSQTITPSSPSLESFNSINLQHIQSPQKRGGGLSAISLSQQQSLLSSAAVAAVTSSESYKDHCNKTVDIFEDVSSPEVTNFNKNQPLTCWYRFRSFRGAPRDWVLRLRFKKFKIGTLINSTYCDGGYLQIVDGNAKTDVSNRREPGMFCGETEQPQTFISETSYVKILFHTDNFTDQTYFSFDSRAEQQMEVYLRYGQHPELYPNRRGEVVQGSYCEREFRDCRLQTCYVQSPAYPGIYPRALKCRYRLHTRQPFIKLYLQNEHFSVDGQRCENIMTCPMREIGSGNEHCHYDWLAVYDGRDEHSPLIGKFCGMGKFPFSIIGTSQFMYVEFVSSPAGPLLNTGFHFNVGNWPGHVDTAGVKNGACDWLLSSDALRQTSASEGIFLSVAHWYPPNTTCSYHIQGNEGEIVRLYFPSFRINRIEAAIVKYETDCAESLTIYDADRPDPARISKTFCDTFSRPMEKIDFVSSDRSLYIRFESKTGSYSGSSLYYWAHYDFFNNTKFGDGVPGTLCDEVFHAWKYPKGDIRSPLNTLIYKRTSGSDVRCQYRFVTDKRLFARVVVEVTAINFKELPYNANACTRCHEERVDKLVIWEDRDKTQNYLACFCDSIPRAVRVISSGEQMNLEMIIQGQHATTSYFKNPNPLFKANYEFAHGPLCGPINLGPSADGELIFPHRMAMGILVSSEQKREKCIWELKVAAQRDLWLHLDKSRFIERGCDQGRIEVYLAGRLEPRFIICPENISLAHDLPILSAAELGALDNENEPLPVLIQYTGDSTVGRNSFRLVWTELFHLPRNADGSLATGMLQDNDCDFKCPGDINVCIPKHLVCNGIVNCPNHTTIASSTITEQQLFTIIKENLQNLQIYETNMEFTLKHLNDESPEICLLNKNQDLSYTKLLIIAIGISVLLAIFFAIICRMCKRKCC